MSTKATKFDIVFLNKKLEYESLTDIFNWDVDHWIEQMQDKLTDAQVKRFIALIMGCYYVPKTVEEKEIIDFLDQFGIERKKKLPTRYVESGNQT